MTTCFLAKLENRFPSVRVWAAIPFNFIDFCRGFPPASRPLTSFVSGEHGERA
jgi:hypothetical protein